MGEVFNNVLPYMHTNILQNQKNQPLRTKDASTYDLPTSDPSTQLNKRTRINLNSIITT